MDSLILLLIALCIWAAYRSSQIPARGLPPPLLEPIDYGSGIARAAVQDYVEEHGLAWSETTIERVAAVAARHPTEPFSSIAARLADERS